MVEASRSGYDLYFSILSNAFCRLLPLTKNALFFISKLRMNDFPWKLFSLTVNEKNILTIYCEFCVFQYRALSLNIWITLEIIQITRYNNRIDVIYILKSSLTLSCSSGQWVESHFWMTLLHDFCTNTELRELAVLIISWFSRYRIPPVCLLFTRLLLGSLQSLTL